ncbi:hypothetical protein FQN60_007273 [Etheostoma spectabile]|uniref:Sodium/potassium-transporting ATPase subunit beta-3 n=1 Tax=Etheostoma spectabile TaxID=54343 RepID=A0A5J5C9D5_9PERO|nr:hypothetical protein FQN60_007273 [Etheostoma spectabile]
MCPGEDTWTVRTPGQVRTNRGLVIRPHAAEISFNRSDPMNYNQYIQNLHELLQRYNDTIQERNDLCLVGEYTEQDEEPIKKVCQFKRSMLSQCSGLRDSSFGFAEGKPCIIIKMNRVIGLKPQGDPYINCTAKRASPLRMQFYPSDARLDKMFFRTTETKLMRTTCSRWLPCSCCSPEKT